MLIRTSRLRTLPARENALYFCALSTDLKWIFIQYLFTNEGGFL
jgi:hypothetical protein